MGKMARWIRQCVAQSGTYLTLGITSILILFPLINILIVSVNTERDLMVNPLNFRWPPCFQNYIYAWEESSYLLYLFNTVGVALMAIIIVVFCASLASYAIDRFAFKEVKAAYYYFMLGIFMPIQVIILPLFRMLRMVNMLNSLIGLAIVYAAISLPLAIIIFTGFMKSIPRELDESAEIDGCHPFQTFWFVILPLVKTVLATVTVLVSLDIWRDFFIPMILSTSPVKKTLASGLLVFQSEFSVQWTKFSAAMTLQAIPIIILFLSLQKYYTKGITAGSVKG